MRGRRPEPAVAQLLLGDGRGESGIARGRPPTESEARLSPHSPLHSFAGRLAAGAAAMDPDPPLPLIPAPVALERRPAPPLALGPGPVLVAWASPAAEPAARALAAVLREVGVDAALGDGGESPAAALVVRVGPAEAPALAAAAPASALDEGYELDIGTGRGELRAVAAAGAFWGVQTVRQLVRWRGPSSTRLPSLPSLTIVDYPAWRWRGLLLDTARHFLPPAALARAVDAAARLKLNVLHWHLTDDHGFRLTVPGRPKLTDVGGWRGETEGDGARHGGVYSPADVASILAAAASRHVTVVPGIDLPGHAGAALAAHPEAGCAGARARPRSVPTRFGVQADTALCPGSDAAAALVDDILDAVVDAFPGRWVHVGGDEVPKAAWAACAACAARAAALGSPPPGLPGAGEPGGPAEGASAEDSLHSWFVARAAARLAAAGRAALAWDDVAPGGLPVGVAVTAWRGHGAGARAAAAGRDVVMCPSGRTYLDYRATDDLDEPGAWWGALDLETAFRFDPGAGDWGPGGLGQAEEGAAPPPSGRPPRPPSGGALGAPHMPRSMSGGAGPRRAVSLAMASSGDGSLSISLAAAPGADEDDVHDDATSGAAGAGAGGLHPTPGQPLAPRLAARVLGGQACLWTEAVPDEAAAQRMLFPRLHALAEAMWSPRPAGGGARDFDSFLSRLDTVAAALDEEGVRRRPHR